MEQEVRGGKGGKGVYERKIKVCERVIWGQVKKLSGGGRGLI